VLIGVDLRLNDEFRLNRIALSIIGQVLRQQGREKGLVSCQQIG
jgi:hypothetical protein